MLLSVLQTRNIPKPSRLWAVLSVWGVPRLTPLPHVKGNLVSTEMGPEATPAMFDSVCVDICVCRHVHLCMCCVCECGGGEDTAKEGTEFLENLKESGGLIHPAKRALLGA